MSSFVFVPCSHVWEACNASWWWNKLHCIPEPKEPGHYVLKHCMNCHEVQWVKRENT